MKEQSKFEKAKETFRILSSPYKLNVAYEIWGELFPKEKRSGSTFWDTDVDYIPRVEYCKFRERKPKGEQSEE